jgi:cell division protein FtsQ
MSRPLPSNRRIAVPKTAEPKANAPAPKPEAKKSAAPKSPSRWRERLSAVVTVSRVVGGGAVFLGLVVASSWGLYHYVSTSPRFAVRHVAVEGAAHRTEADVTRIAEIESGRNIFSIDLDAAKRRLLADPWIEKADVTRRLPGDLRVVISEREPVALVSLGGSLYLAAQGGEVFKRWEPGDPVDFVVITGAGNEGEMIRDRAGVTSQVKRGEDVIAEYDRLGPTKTYPLQEVHITDEGNVELIVGRDPVRLSLGKSPYRAKLERGARVLAEVDRRKGQPSVIFLDNDAHPERVVARMR